MLAKGVLGSHWLLLSHLTSHDTIIWLWQVYVKLFWHCHKFPMLMKHCLEFVAKDHSIVDNTSPGLIFSENILCHNLSIRYFDICVILDIYRSLELNFINQHHISVAKSNIFLYSENHSWINLFLENIFLMAFNRIFWYMCYIKHAQVLGISVTSIIAVLKYKTYFCILKPIHDVVQFGSQRSYNTDLNITLHRNLNAYLSLMYLIIPV